MASCGHDHRWLWRVVVSIPFKRESASQAGPRGRCVEPGVVSIPFKRERGDKANMDLVPSGQAECFHSLQTGTRIARGCRYYKVYAKAGNMSNFFQCPLNAGRLPLGVHTALQGCRLARSRPPKVETLQGCRIARVQRKCQRLFRPNISKVKTRFAAQKRRVRTFRRLLSSRSVLDHTLGLGSGPNFRWQYSQADPNAYVLLSLKQCCDVFRHLHLVFCLKIFNAFIIVLEGCADVNSHVLCSH